MGKINVAELLKDCPQGMELDCTVYNDVTFLRIDEVQNRCYFKAGLADTFWTTCEGRINGSPFGKCVIFPKGKTTWEGFVPFCQFKDGDIVATSSGLWIGITTGGEINSFIPTYCVIKHNGEFEAYLDKKQTWQFYRLATEKEKQKLFNAIKANGYKWNPATKTLEKLIKPKFKVGDRIRHKEEPKWTCVIRRIDDRYWVDGHPTCDTLLFGEHDEYELVPNKFDINTLKPFESRVLVRSSYNIIWRPAIYGVIDSKKHCHYVVGGNFWEQCIPYKGNEHLLGKTDDCDEFYKTWE